MVPSPTYRSSRDFEHTPLRIGVFDSGVGGLTVLDRLLDRLPPAEYFYLGDTLLMPYGLRPLDELKYRLLQILDWFQREHQPDLVVVACNTASATLPILPELPYRGHQIDRLAVVDTIHPICSHLGGLEQPFERVGLMATPSTIHSRRYNELMHQWSSKTRLRAIPCLGLASAIEHGQTHTPGFMSLLEGYVKPLANWNAQGIILGCTHYPHIRPQIERILKTPGPLILDPAECVAAVVAAHFGLTEEPSTGGASEPGRRPPRRVHCMVTGSADAFLTSLKRLAIQDLLLNAVENVHIRHQ
ncbi:MAG: glutamate racemase [Candidatus Melainabacteria bacterium]|nr:glutamate racemase [Candidatus Melainabacteria bacterium]